MSDLDHELLGLAEDDPHRRSKKKQAGSKNYHVESDEDDADDVDVEGEEEMDMDDDVSMDLESEEEDDEPAAAPAAASRSTASGSNVAKKKPRTADVSADHNPYPLEGKYIDEDDRDELDALPEIERENILATRLEEMQKFKDSQALEAMFRSAGMAGTQDEDDEGEGPSRKKRKHTSVTKEASKAIKELKNRRKAGDERAARRAARREARARSTSPGSDAHSTEDGEIGYGETSVQRDMDRTSPPAKSKKAEKKPDLDSEPPKTGEVNSARLSRYEIVDMCYKDGFEEVVQGAFVRLMSSDMDERGQPKYRIHKILEVDTSGKHGRYSIEYKGRTVMDDRGLLCQYGKAKRLFRIADVSNGDFLETEYIRFRMTCEADGVKLPRRSELQTKHDAIKELRDRAMSNEEISRQVEARKRSNPHAQKSKILSEISQIMSSRDLALRRNDLKGASFFDQQIVDLGGDPRTGLLSGSQDQDTEDRLEKIAENQRRRTKEAMANAHLAAIKRKKAEEAALRAAKSRTNSPAPTALPKAVVPPAAALKKGETPQKYIARTIDLDLGDF